MTRWTWAKARMAFKYASTLCAVIAVQALSVCGTSAEPVHGLSSFGDLKYKPGFAHFDYVNPAAPKGGRLVTIGTQALSTFDSFNAFILKGDAAQGVAELVYDSLMTRATDEPDSLYGLLAESADVAADKRSVVFKIRPEAKFADGTPVTAADCVFTFQALKEKGHPMFGSLLRNVESATAVDALSVRYTFKGDEIRDLPLVVAVMPVLPKAFYDTHPFDQSWLDRPLGSGPYKIGDYNQGSSVTFTRRTDYWGKDLNVTRGRFNFDEVKYDYYRLRTAGMQALKAGLVDLREEFTSKDWATAYDIAPVHEGKMNLKLMPDQNPSGTQGYWINTRRAKFADVRVRQALGYAFDFEWANKHLFYNAYKRTASYFENSALKASGLPSAGELALLEPFRDKVAAEVFGEAQTPPVSNGSGSDRKMMAEAERLLNAAGYVKKDGKRITPDGQLFSIEFLISDPSSERILARFISNLQGIGIDASARMVDEAQYLRRVKAFDYDIASSRFTMQITPGPELKIFFGSEAAASEGSFNMAGIKDPVADALIAKIVTSRSREELQTAGRALDRVLLAGYYWVPNWYQSTHKLAFWDKFEWPKQQPLYDTGILDTWWYASDKAAKLTSN